MDLNNASNKTEHLGIEFEIGPFELGKGYVRKD